MVYKKEFSCFDVAAVVYELKKIIQDCRVNNIYQLGSKSLVLKLHQINNPAIWLVLEAGRRLHLTSYTMQKPVKPPSFCMALRKHLRNSWLIDVKQYEFDRVVVLTFKTKIGVRQLILEIFGKQAATYCA